MKALVLAGGLGTRMRPLTYTCAKQLLPVANRPVLLYGLEALREAGVQEVGIVVGDTAPAIQDAVGDGSGLGLSVSYIRQETPLGLAHAVLISRGFLGDDEFIMYLADNFIVGGITGLVAEFRAGAPDAQILLAPVSNPGEFGVAELDQAGRVVRLVEKPANPRSNLAVVGAYLFTRAIHEAVRKLTPSRRGELEITDAIQYLIDVGHKVNSTIFAGYWKDLGDVAGILEVNRLLLAGLEARTNGHADGSSELVGRVVLQEGARIIRSRVVGPAIIGTRSQVTDSYIGPFTSVAERCTITDAEIENSILLPGASIRGVRRIEGSLIGQHAEVVPALYAPRVHRLILGDHSRVQIGTSGQP